MLSSYWNLAHQNEGDSPTIPHRSPLFPTIGDRFGGVKQANTKKALRLKDLGLSWGVDKFLEKP
jgi:hypothetical protein